MTERTEEPVTARCDGRAQTAAPARPLRRNRAYNLLWSSNVLSQLGSQATLFAYPLLVMAMTGSVFQASLVEFAVAASRMVAGLPAGAVADRVSRKRVMLVSEAARALALAVLAVAIAAGRAPLALILAVAVVEGVSTALFSAADQALLPLVVPEPQLSSAVARNTARYYVATITGPGLGGVLYNVLRVLPFAAQAVASLGALGVLLFLRAPEERARIAAAEPGGLLRHTLTGLRWLCGHRLLRVTVGLTMGFNAVFSGLLLVAIGMAQQAGATDEVGPIGMLMGTGGVLGALAAPWLRLRLAPYTAVLLLTWGASALVPLLAVLPAGYCYGAVLGCTAFLAPTATAIIATHQMTTTPDAMRGRLAGAIGVSLGAASAVGTLAGGALLEFSGPVATVLAATAVLVLLALLATLSGAIRALPAPGGPGPGRSA
ncbi:MFS transporter [Kitasatospora aureofaciens]|uniref:MFS transporter n=1 Tax=Kitasatospora aureofaciens TaxID=1894 RepID=A0A8H9LNZ1_KITAU|nr:MFS transporter [Kitasatospora aureofaciens]GGU79758.1 MFS transporter [Kitasatospora aureofaciens]